MSNIHIKRNCIKLNRIVLSCFVVFLLTYCCLDYFFVQKIDGNVEALSQTELPSDPCTSPKTMLGLGWCTNITSVICKDDSGRCN